MRRLRPLLLIGAVAMPASAPAAGPPERAQVRDWRESDRAFMAAQQALKRALEAALIAADWDRVAAAPALDAAVERFQPAFDSYATEMLERQRAKIAKLPARQRPERLAAAVDAAEMIRGTPRYVRSILERNGSLTPPPPPPPMHR